MRLQGKFDIDHFFLDVQSQLQEIAVQIEKKKSHRKHFETKLKELQDAIKRTEADYARNKAHVEVTQS